MSIFFNMTDKTNIPKHVAIIMDGNRRWAKTKGLPAIAGHTYAAEQIVEKLIKDSAELGIKYLTLWAFSTENWGRAEEEVSGLMNIFRKALVNKVEKFIKNGAKLKMIGDMTKFSPDIQEGMKQAEKKSKNNTKITVTFALNYGGRDEIVRAVNRLISESAGQQISESDISASLDTAGMPDPDLIIRTGGAQRMSGFMPWQGVYSEYYFTETLMPEFGPEQLEEAIEEYQSRQRRYGK